MNETLELDKIDQHSKLPQVKLSVPLLALYMRKGMKQTEIANVLNVSRQAVNDYIKRHIDELEPLKHTNDDLIAMNAKHIASKAMGRLEHHLDSTTQKDLMALNAISGTHIDKYRLMTGQSTENTLNISLIADVNELLKSLKQ